MISASLDIYFFRLGQSGSFIGDRIQLNPNVSQVEMGNQPADALIFINFTTGAHFALLYHDIMVKTFQTETLSLSNENLLHS